MVDEQTRAGTVAIERRKLLQATASGLVGASIFSGTASGETDDDQETDDEATPMAYVGTPSGLFAVDAESGETEWGFDDPDGTIWSSPTVVDGVVYFGDNDGVLWAVDAVTGELEWKFDDPGDWVQSSPTVVDGTVYIGEGGGLSVEDWEYGMYAIDAETGEQKWRFNEIDTDDTDHWGDHLRGRVVGSPAVADGTVYVGTDSISVYAIDAATGELEWWTETSNHVRHSPTIHDGTLYVRAHELHAYDAETGEEDWAFPIPGDGVYGNSSPTVFDGTVYVATRGGELYAIDTESGTEKWVFDEPEDDSYTATTVVDGLVYVSFGETLYAVNTETGDKEWEYNKISPSGMAAPTVFHGRIYTSGTAIHAVDAKTGDELWVSDTIGTTESGPTVALDPENGDSVGSRVMLGTLGHHDPWANGSPILDHFTAPEEDEDGTESDDGDDGTTENGDDGTTENGDGGDETIEDGGGDDGAGEDGDDGVADDGRTDGAADQGTDGDGTADDDQSDESADDDGPGFGVGSALTGIGGAGYVLYRRAKATEQFENE